MSLIPLSSLLTRRAAPLVGSVIFLGALLVVVVAILNVLHLPIDSAVRHAARDSAVRHAARVRYLSSFSSVFDWLASASGSYFPTLLDWSRDCGDFVSGDADALALAAAFGCGGDLDSARRFVSDNCAAIVSPYVAFGRAADFSDAVTRGRGLLWCGDVAGGRVDPLSAFTLAEIWALWLRFPRDVRDLAPSFVSSSVPVMVGAAIRTACRGRLD